MPSVTGHIILVAVYWDLRCVGTSCAQCDRAHNSWGTACNAWGNAIIFSIAETAFVGAAYFSTAETAPLFSLLAYTVVMV